MHTCDIQYIKGLYIKFLLEAENIIRLVANTFYMVAMTTHFFCAKEYVDHDA